MKFGKKAVIGLPVKLMVVFLILSISAPMLMNAVEQNEKVTVVNVMENEFGKFYDTVSKVHYSGLGSTRTVVLDIPDGCTAEIGGESANAYSMRAFYEGEKIKERYMEQPAVILLFDGTLDAGKHTLTVKSILLNGKAAAEVKKI